MQTNNNAVSVSAPQSSSAAVPSTSSQPMNTENQNQNQNKISFFKLLCFELNIRSNEGEEDENPSVTLGTRNEVYNFLGVPFQLEKVTKNINVFKHIKNPMNINYC